MQTDTTAVRENDLLVGLPDHEAARLAPFLSPADLTAGQVLYRAGDPVDRIYFLRSAVVSCVVPLAHGGSIEALILGREAAVGAHAAFGVRSAAWRPVVQLEGEALAITPHALATASTETPELIRRLMQHAHFMQQMSAQSIACTRFHPVVERLARWLLMMLDRTDGTRLRVTHELVGLMLGANRPTVTMALGQLLRAGLIEPAHRGQVIVLDRTGLEDAACECYAALASAARGIRSGYGGSLLVA